MPEDVEHRLRHEPRSHRLPPSIPPGPAVARSLARHVSPVSLSLASSSCSLSIGGGGMERLVSILAL